MIVATSEARLVRTAVPSVTESKIFRAVVPVMLLAFNAPLFIVNVIVSTPVVAAGAIELVSVAVSVSVVPPESVTLSADVQLAPMT